MDKKTIINAILRISTYEPDFYIIEANQLLNSALLILEEDPTTASILFGRAEKLLLKRNQNKKENNKWFLKIFSEVLTMEFIRYF